MCHFLKQFKRICLYFLTISCLYIISAYFLHVRPFYALFMQSGLGSLLNNIHAIGARFGPGLPVEDRAPGVLPAPDPFPPPDYLHGRPGSPGRFFRWACIGPRSCRLCGPLGGAYIGRIFAKKSFFREHVRTRPPVCPLLFCSSVCR